MRIILASEYFYPVSKGGTEMYVYQLAKEIIKSGHECLIISVSDDLENSNYEDISIRYIPYEKNTYDDTNQPKNLSVLLNLVRDFKPDVFHLHTYTPTLGIKHLQAIKGLGVKVYFTSHLPSLTCLRGDLMFYGEEVCDGIMDKSKCMNCYINTSSYNSLTKFAFTVFSNLNIFKSSVGVLRSFEVKLRNLYSLKKTLDKLIVVSEWQKTVLCKNGFNPEEVIISRQAIFPDKYLDEKEFDTSAPLKIGFIGRIVKIKGLHVLLRVLRNFNVNKFQLHIAAIKAENEIDYYNEQKEISNKINVVWRENLSNIQIVDFLDSIDILVIPSTMLETGPYTAFEALSRKVPILSFNYGGVAELIENGSTGFLVDSELEMSNRLSMLIENKELLVPISQNINFKRDAKLIYDEMITLYTI